MGPGAALCLQEGTGSGAPKRAIALLLLLAGLTAPAAAADAPPEPLVLRVAVLAHRGNERAVRQWRPTADYLSRELPGTCFEIVPVSNNDIGAVVAAGQVDFVLTNPGSYAGLEHEHGVTRFATLRKGREHGGRTHFAAVIFTRADRADIRDLEDLRGKSFMAIHENAFGGWWMAWKALRDAGLTPARDFKSLRFSGFPQDRVVLAVREGRVDAGTVRAETLAGMIAKGEVSGSELRVLHPRSDTGYGLPHSTRLYPEWPFAALPATPRALVQQVLIALLRMPYDDPAALAANISGWTVPMSYQPVHELMKELRVGPYAIRAQVGALDLLRAFWPWIAGAAIAVLGVLVLSMLTMNRRVTRHRNYLRDTLLSIGDAVVTLDAKGHIDFMNRPARNLACASKQGQQTARFDERFSLEDAVTGLPISLSQAALRHAEQAGLALRSRSAVLDCDHGRVTDLKLTVTPVHDEHRNTRGWVVVMHDITQMQQLARRLGHQATHDDLTGLVNRREFTRRLQNAIDTAARGRHEHVMCFIDLDQFKIVNDTCGHEAGDRLLKQLSSLLRSKLRAHDTVARLGGDEFGVLMEDCGLERGEAIAEQLRGAVEAHRFEWDGKLFGVGASIGVVSVSAESGTLAELMSFADTACFAAKEQGRNRVQVHRSGDLAVDGRHRALNWAQRITRALQEDGWVLFVQPIMEPGGQGEQRRFEVLVRMRGEDGDLILPRAFLAAAERFNLMPALDRWVVEHALAMIRRIQPLHPSFGWSLNLSGQTLDDPRFADFVIEQLRASGVAGSSICFEITERAAIANLSTATSFMARMKEQGVRFALDDFGSGLSSFCCLNDLPVDYLKIDGSIVKQAASNSVSRAVAASIQSIARSMGIATIAELVSNEEIRHVMEEIGVSYAQGKIMGPPHEMSLLLEPPEQAIGVAPLQPPAAGFQPTAES